MVEMGRPGHPGTSGQGLLRVHEQSFKPIRTKSRLDFIGPRRKLDLNRFDIGEMAPG